MIVRRLGPGDEAVVAALAGEREPQSEYLVDENALHWVAEENGAVLGQLLCYLERRCAGDARQLLLYEIEVVEQRRREGVGRALVAAMEEWMREHDVTSVWVLADNDGAEAFYAACGFARDDDQPVQMSRRL